MEGIDQKGILVGDLYRMKRKEDENMLDHIEQARSEVKEHDLVKTELLSIITAEMKEVIGDIKRFMMTNIEFINKNLELIKELEKECIDEVNRVKNMENLLEKLSKLKVQDRKAIKFYSCQTLGHYASEHQNRRKKYGKTTKHQ